MSRQPRFPLLRRFSATAVMLALVVMAAASLRLYNLNWDDGNLLHPDELHVRNTLESKIRLDWPPDIGNLLDPEASRLNPRSNDPDTGRPHNFAYGALPLIVVDFAASVMNVVSDRDWHAFDDGIPMVGRSLSALMDCITVVFVFLIGRRLFSPRAGLVGAAIYAATPVAIQLSHFFTTDIWMTAFAVICLYAAIRAAQEGELRWFAASGLTFGLAMASKASVPMLALVVAAAAVSDLARRRRDGERGRLAFAAMPERLVLAGLAALAGFALFEPYALVRLGVYLDQLEEQRGIAGGTIDVPYTRQYVGIPRGVYQAEQLFRWGLGPVAAILCLLGVAYLARTAYRSRLGGTPLLLVWLAGQGVVTVLPQTKFLRYTEPLLPALAIGAGAVLVAAVNWAVPRVGRVPVAAAGTAVMLGIALWTAAFMAIYADDNPRVEASRWIYANVPPGSNVTSESWDLGLPLSFAPGLSINDHQLGMVEMDLYGDRAPEEVADDIFSYLQSADYVVLSSNRVSSAMPRSPWRYPVQIRYYDLLESGQLGYELVAKFQNEPKIGPLRFDDASADESFINYDHPTVLVYQKTNFVDRGTYDALMAPATAAPWSPTRYAPKTDLLLDEPVGEQPVVADARWSSTVTHRTLPAILVWLVLLFGLQAIGLPITARLFPRFPDLGWGFARLVATLLAAYAVWILASIELISFRAIWSAAAVASVAALAAVSARRRGLGTALRSRAKPILGAEAVFWAVFGLFLFYRFVNPDSWHPIWGGEKPMEFAHLNAILRSAHFPPYDPWYADGYINYYYYGTYLVAFLVKLTGIPSEIAFNLAQPTVIALIASTGYSVAAAISRDLVRRRIGVIGGTFGAFFLVIAGNLADAVQVVRTFPDQIRPNFDDWTWGPSRAITGAITEFPYFTGLYADLHAHVIAWPITLLAMGLAYSIAQQPRLLAVAIGGSRHRAAAAGAVAARFGMLVVVLGSLFATNAWDVPVYAALAGVAYFMATANLRDVVVRLVTAGFLTAATGGAAYLLFLPFFQHYVALFGSLERTRTRTDVDQIATHFGVFFAIAGVGVMALSFRRGLAWRWLAMVDPAVIAALFVGLIGVLVLGVGDHAWIDNLLVISAGALFGAAGANEIALSPHSIYRAMATAVLPSGLAISTLLALDDRLTLSLAMTFVSVGATLWLIANSRAARFVGALLTASMAIVACIEIVFLADDLSGDPVWYRMNTVFKFYNQTWAMLAVATASLLTLMLVEGGRRAPAPDANVYFFHGATRTRPLSEPESDEPDVDGDASIDTSHDRPADMESLAGVVFGRWRQVGVVTAAILIAGSISYPLFATGPRLAQRFPGNPGIGTLNALDWMRYGTIVRPDRTGNIAFADDLKVINWFNDEVKGTPVIAEASIGPYRGNGSRISIATGLPDVLGWDRHERQQRYPEGIDARSADVRTLYQTADVDEKVAILRQYDVAYVVVGDVERYSYIGGEQYATPEGIAAFDEMVGTSLEVAYESGGTTVYRVLPAAG